MITLREATIEDTGSYECKAVNVAGTTTASTTIEVQQAPTIILTPDRQTIEVTEGDELRFTCAATGIPEPSIQIKSPEGSNVRQAPITLRGHRTGRPEATINHPNIQLSQGGLFECIAHNEAGQDLRYIQVTVSKKRGDVGELTTDNECHPK